MYKEESELIEMIQSKDYKINTHTKEFNFSDFITPKLIKEFTSISGVRYIANNDIKKGELLIVEKALVYIFPQEYEKFKYEILNDLDRITDDDFEDENYHIYEIIKTKLEEALSFEREAENLTKKLSTLFNGINIDLSIEERSEILLSIKYIDDIKIYQTENDLENLLISNKIDIRFLGDDYKNSNFTAKNLDIEIKFIDRNHGWSTTKMKKLIINNK
jgi:hypothetical protein